MTTNTANTSTSTTLPALPYEYKANTEAGDYRIVAGETKILNPPNATPSVTFEREKRVRLKDGTEETVKNLGSLTVPLTKEVLAEILWDVDLKQETIKGNVPALQAFLATQSNLTDLFITADMREKAGNPLGVTQGVGAIA